MVTSYKTKTIVQCHNQCVDIHTVKTQTVPLPQGSLLLPFYNHTFLSSSQLLLSSLFSISIILLCKMLYKWNQGVCKFGGFTFITQRILWISTRVILCINSLSLFIASFSKFLRWEIIDLKLFLFSNVCTKCYRFSF